MSTDLSFLEIKNKFQVALGVSALTTTLLYPLDVAHGHMAADMTVGQVTIEEEGSA